MECTLYLTDDCNLKCSYCYEGHDKLHSRISQATIEKAIDFMFQNNFEISLSVDGKKETHILNRHIKSKQSDEELYEKIIDNLKYMVNKKITFTVRMTVTCNNVHHFYENVKYFWELGVRRFDIAFNEFEIWSAYYLQRLEQELQRLDVFYLSNPDEIESINLYDGKMTFFIAKRELRFCSAGRKSHFVISSKGEFYPCINTHNDALCLGNLKRDSIDDLKKLLSSNDRRQQVKKYFDVEQKQECQQCFYKYFCNGFCGAYETEVNGDKASYKEYVCRVRQAYLEFEMFYREDKDTLQKYMEKKRQYLFDCLKVRN